MPEGAAAEENGAAVHVVAAEESPANGMSRCAAAAGDGIETDMGSYTQASGVMRSCLLEGVASSNCAPSMKICSA